MDADSNVVNDGDIEYGVRRSQRTTSFSRRDSSANNPLQFMEIEVYLEAAELCLMMCQELCPVIALLAILHRQLSTKLAKWQQMLSVPVWAIHHLTSTTAKIKETVDHVITTIKIIQSAGEVAMLRAMDLTYYVRPRLQQFGEERNRRLGDIDRRRCNEWFAVPPHELKQFFIHWRIPEVLRTNACEHSNSETRRRSFPGEACFLIFLYHLMKGGYIYLDGGHCIRG